MRELDSYSYNCGVIDCFCEMVRAGVKPLALSHAFSTAVERDEYLPHAEAMAEQYGVHFLPEDELIVTDLFPVEACRGVYILLFGTEESLAAYQVLKEKQADLIAQGTYLGEARAGIAQEFGRLLGYAPAAIEAFIAANTQQG